MQKLFRTRRVLAVCAIGASLAAIAAPAVGNAAGVGQASGSGTIDPRWGGHCPSGTTPSFEFSAIGADVPQASVSHALGSFEFACSNSSGVVYDWHGQVACVVVDGNEAVVGGVIVGGSWPHAIPGTELSWAMRDGGDGAGDQISVLRAGLCPLDETPNYIVTSGDLAVSGVTL